MANLLSDADADTVGTGASMSGPCTVYVRGTFDGASVAIQIADEDVSASYVKPDRSVMRESRFNCGGAVSLTAYGDYYVRAVLASAGDTTEVSVVALQ